MRFAIDMNLSPAWVGIFADIGIEATHWSMIGPANAPDTEIMAWASRHGGAVFTHDLDFATILHLPPPQTQRRSNLSGRCASVNHGQICLRAILQTTTDL
jgi:predicted nuclease of predicted toxin-antitoxin system